VREYRAIEFFSELDLKWHHLDEMNDDQKSALAVICFAVSEVNALSRMYLFAHHELSGFPAIDFAIMTQVHSVLRNWSAKLFEMSEFLSFRDKDNRTTDKQLIRLGSAALDAFKKLKDDEGYRVARALRHEATNHYLLGPVRKNLPFVSDRANCTFFLHKQRGNSIYPLGDEVLFAGRLNREGAKFDTTSEKKQAYDKWFDWNLKATDWLHDVHLDFFREFIGPIAKKHRLRLRLRDYWIDPILVSDRDSPKIPVVFRNSK
jgi:hypothetical protein